MATILGTAADDTLTSSSRPFDTTPDVMIGGAGSDTYVVPQVGRFPIYSEPIIWVLFQGDVDIHEAPAAGDIDTLDLRDSFMTLFTSIQFDGTDLYMTGWAGAAQEVRVFDNYGVDADGNLLAGIDRVVLYDYDTGGDVELDLTVANPFLSFVRNGTNAADTLAGDDAANVIDGRDGDDALNGGAGADFIAGGLGRDRVKGGADADRLFGGAGTDNLFGGDGDDQLSGMGGRDRLTGGGGADRFVFDHSGRGADVIKDFGAAGGDQIDLSGLVLSFDPAAGALADFVWLTAAAHGSWLEVDANGANGGAHFVRVALLSGVTGSVDAQALYDDGALLVG